MRGRSELRPKQTKYVERRCEKMVRQRRAIWLDQSVIEPLSCASLVYSDSDLRAVKYKSRSIG